MNRDPESRPSGAMNPGRPARFEPAWSVAFCAGGVMIGQGMPAAKWYVNAGMVLLFLTAVVFLSWQRSRR